jgi:hypothetical protein
MNPTSLVLTCITGIAAAAAVARDASAQQPVRTGPEGFVEVVVPTRPDGVTLRLTSDQPADVAETRRIALPAGRSRLRFDWSREHLDEGSLRFDVALAGGSATVPERTKIRRRGGMTYFDVDASAAGDATITSRYLLSGIGWRVDYVGEMNAAGDELALALAAEITNRSGQDLAHARVLFDGGELGDVTLGQGERREVDLFRVEKVALARRYLFDPTRYGATPAIELEVENKSGTPLARPFLPAGKIRIVAPQDDGRPGLIGEDVFPATPLGEKAKLYVGHARDLTVERALAAQNNENERRDRWNKVVAYDQRTKLTYKLRNGSGKDATLRIVEHPGPLFEIAASSPAAVKKSSDTIEMDVPLPANGSVEASLEWVRKNLW